jgi:hypothetical protein
MPRGRPNRSQIRKNLVELLYFLGKGYGYEIYKHYVEVFPRVTMRSIYYHLHKGEALKEFTIAKIEKVKGTYSWGGEAEKKYYTLGPAASPTGDSRVKEHLDHKKR